MPTTLSDLRTQVSRDLRDTGNATWSTAELDDLINQGIDKVADLYPKEVQDYTVIVSSGVASYTLPTTFTRVYRIDIYSSSNLYQSTLLSGIGEGPNTGWEVHAGLLWLPPDWLPDANDKLRIFGYGRYAQLSVSSATTDLNQTGIWALRSFCKSEAFYALLYDRARFQQWQTDQTNTDVSLIQLAQFANLAQRTWSREQQRLRRLRKLG